MNRNIFLLFLLLLFIIGIGLIAVSIKPVFDSWEPQITKIIPKSSSLPSISPDFEQARVRRVIDGDTIELSDSRKVRLIGINAPEDDSKQPIECYANEAKQKAQELLSEQNVLMERDISETDKYGRLLRYVYTQDKIMINEILVKQGFAQADAYPPDTKYQQQLFLAQEQAKAASLGLWRSCRETIRQ